MVEFTEITRCHGVTPLEWLDSLGVSGCGKSTIGRTLLRLITATEGSVRLDREHIFSLPDEEMRQKMQIIFQDPFGSLNPRMTVAVVYLGRIVKEAKTADLFGTPKHPYTRSSIAAAPRPDPTSRNLRAPVQGDLPSALNQPSGCAFHPRCAVAQDKCRVERPPLRALGASLVACHFGEDTETVAPIESARSDALRNRLAVLEAARQNAANRP